MGARVVAVTPALVALGLTALAGGATVLGGLLAVHRRVRDTGPGVPDQLREAVFVRGFSTKPEVLGGRGIGLPLVQLICSARGGSVSVGRAEAEGGAEFVVTLPVGAPAGSEETHEVGSR